MVLVGVLPGMAGAFIAVAFMCMFIVGANEDRYLENESNLQNKDK